VYTWTMDFLDSIKPGLIAEENDTVSDKNTAMSLGSGGLAVFATPAMIALMEKAALQAVAPCLPPGWSTVGTEVNIKHNAPTPLGMKVSAKAELLSIDGRNLSFKVEAFDETGIIGEGTHNRFIIDEKKFMAKTESKKAAQSG